MPKNFKFKYIWTDEPFYRSLIEEGFDLTETDTIHSDNLVDVAQAECDWVELERDIIKKAKEPTVLEHGIILSKKLATKADKKLEKVLYGIFEDAARKYVAVKLQYAQFDIIQIFVLI
jgi:hypothetical protein